MNDLGSSILTFFANFHPWALPVTFVLLFACSMLVVPWAVVQIPADYFKHPSRRPPPWRHYPPWLRLLMLIAKNLLGLLLVLIGVALFVLPGPGMVTLVIGLLMLDVPGKFRFQRWLLSHRFILQAANWLRIKRKKPPFQQD